MENTKVFLSHSSKQKWFVKIVAEKLGKSNIVYDEWTFDSGSKTLDEIFQGIDNSGIFIYFISNEALDSKWVEREINRAEEYLKSGRIRKFLPLLIDQSITHNDVRIPEWISESYNLKYISKPTKAFDLIKQALMLVTWDINPKKKELDQLFIGRTGEIKKFEERAYDFDRPFPSAFFISGLFSIGRRKFTKHVLVNFTKIKAQYVPPTITLNSSNSIEDLINRLYGLGYTQYTVDHILDLTKKTIEEKVNISIDFLNELHNNNDLLFIEDNFCIVGRDGVISDWFLAIIERLNQLKDFTVCIISQARIRAKFLIRNDSIFSIEIPELESYERKALFNSILKLEKIELKAEEFKTITNQFFGFPEQIFYTLLLLQHEGKDYVLNNPHEIVEFNTTKVARIIRNYSINKIAFQVLKLLSNFEFLSFGILKDVLKEDFEQAKSIITQLSNEYIIEYIGGVREFPRLNDSVRDYIQRLGYRLDNKYSNNLKIHVETSFKDYEIADRDISDYVISFKEALKMGYEVPEQLLVPSHYVNAMRELYNYEQRYDVVIILAERVLQNEVFLDKRILREIRYWYCSALARKRSKKILEEVQKIDEPDRSFLLGFYYRIIGRNEDALEKFSKTLQIAPYYYRATREIIQVYLNTDQYKEAFSLAKQSYYKDTNNPYNLQSYFRCLIKLNGASSKEEILRLLNGLRDSPHEKSPEMYQISLSQFYSFIENNDGKAIQTIDDAISSFPKSIYPYLTKLDILRKAGNWEEIGKTLLEIQQSFDDESDIYNKLTFLWCQSFYLSYIGKTEQATRILEKRIRLNFSEEAYRSLYNTINDNN